MIEVTFLPSPLRPWANVNSGPHTAHVTGWAFDEGSLLKDEALGRHIMRGLDTSLPITDILMRLNGNFAVVVVGPDRVHIGVDVIRSIPLFYRWEGECLTVSDDARQLMDGPTTVDGDSAIEFAAAGFVTGRHTLFHEISGLQTGECMTWRAGSESPETERYYLYTCSYDSDSSIDDLCEVLDETMTSAFRRMIDTLDGRQVVVPLSGGLDSRLLAATLKRFQYDNVLCYSYGVPGNRESVRSEQVAKVLGYPWVQTAYSPDLWRDALGSDEIRQYRSFSANGVSFPYHDDWPAVRALREQGAVSAGAVFAPGHAADFIAGDHLKYLFDPFIWEGDPHDIEGALVKKHYSLWSDFVDKGQVRDAIGRRIEESVGSFPGDTDEDVARMFEYWEWQERQSKFIVNSVRVYEFFGFSWRLPFWDRAFMDFWRPITISLKMREYLYRRYVHTHDHMNLFQEDGPESIWTRDVMAQQRPKRLRRKVFDAASHFPVVTRLYDRYRIYRRHLREWKRDPREEAHVYRKLKYLLFDSGKRHVQSLAVRDFLRNEYGLEMSSLSRGREDSTAPRRPQTVGDPGGIGRTQWP